MSHSLNIALLRIWSRNRSRFTADVPLLAVVAAFVALYIAVSSFALSGAQVADRELGPSGASVVVHQQQATRYPDRAVLEAMTAAGAKNVRVAVYGSDLQIDGFRSTGLSTGPQDRLEYMEWQQGSKPSRYAPAAGRWPSRSGEVMLSETLSVRLGNPSTIRAFSNSTRLAVVGTFRDVYATKGLEVVGAPGTWRQMSAAASTGYPDLTSTTQYLWDGVELDAMIPVIAQASGTPVDDLHAGALDRAFLQGRAQRSLFAHSSYLIVIPCLLLCGAVQLTTTTRLSRSLQVERAAMLRMGIPMSATLLPTLGVVLLVCLGACLIGVGIGWLAGQVIRSAVLPHFMTQPLSPTAPVILLGLSLLGLTVILSLLSIAVFQNVSWRPGQGSARFASLVSWGRRIGAVGLLMTALITVYGARQLDGAVKSVVLSALGLALVVPDILTGLIAVLHLPSLSGRLALTNVRADRPRVRALGSALCMCLAIPASVTVIMASYLSSSAALSMAIPGQLVVQSPSGQPLPKNLPQRIQAGAGLPAPLAVHILEGQISPTGTPGAQGVMVVAQPSEAERVLGITLDQGQRAALQDGAMLGFDEFPDTVELSLDSGRRVGVPTRHVAVPPTWSFIYGGVLLESSAKALHAASMPDLWVYAGVDEAQIAKAIEFVHTQKLDPRVLTYYKVPPKPELPPSLWAVCLALLVIGVTITMGVCSSFGETARGQSRQLLAIGLPPKFCRTVPISQSLLLVVTCGLLASLVAVGPVILAHGMSHSLHLSVPHDWVLGWVAVLGLLALIGPLTGLRGIRAKDRLADDLA